MDDTRTKSAVEAHQHPNYLAVFIVLAVITALITAVELLSQGLPIPPLVINTFFIVMAVVKATLVAMFYMHLKQDSWLYTALFGLPVLFALFLMFMLLI